MPAADISIADIVEATQQAMVRRLIGLRYRIQVEPVAVHTKAEQRMDLCWMKGALGEALHALCCAPG